MKVTIVGAGNVGASCAEYIAIKEIASEVVILDIKEGLAEGKLSIYTKLLLRLVLAQKLLESPMITVPPLAVML